MAEQLDLLEDGGEVVPYKARMEDLRERAILRRGLSPTHELMAEWILLNPGGTLKQMGEFFGYSVSWLSQVLNTDMFKAHIAERMQGIKAYASMSIPEKMSRLADKAIERVAEVLDTEKDSKVIADTFDKVMHRYGYAPNARNALQPSGPKQAPGQQNNVFFLNREDFQRVQGKLISSHVEGREHSPSALPNPQAPSVEDDSADDA